MKPYALCLELSRFRLVADRFAWELTPSRFLSLELRCPDQIARGRNKQERNRLGQLC